MKATISELGVLTVEPENSVEAYALSNWSANYDKNGGDSVLHINNNPERDPNHTEKININVEPYSREDVKQLIEAINDEIDRGDQVIFENRSLWEKIIDWLKTEK